MDWHNFSSLKASVALLDTMRASPLGGGFQVSHNFTPVPEVLISSNNRVLSQ